MSRNNTNNKLWTNWVTYLIILSIAIFIFSFFAPFLLTQFSSSIKFDTNTGPIGDTIGGIMNPFVALSGVIVTGLAFYMQLRANQIQIENFRKELEVQKEQNRLAQFESKFYEMLRLHKENVNEIEIEIFEFNLKNIHNTQSSGKGLLGGRSPVKEISKTPKIIKGRQVFLYFSNEIEITYNYLKNNNRNNANIDTETKGQKYFSIAYNAFFNGAINQKDYSHLKKVIEEHKNFYLDEDNKGPYREKSNEFYGSTVLAKYFILQGHENILGHYYRHLYHTVKFVAHQNEDFISFKEKRNYLRLLRAQLSNYEQAMLFYNYLIFSNEWENEENKFLSDYKMIHNLKPSILIKSDFLRNKYNELSNKSGRSYKEEDTVFE